MDEHAFIRIKMPISNLYILPCDDGYLLIDTYVEKGYERFVGEMERQGIRPEEIEYILLTHHHDDHAGLATRLAGETGARIIAHEKGLAALGKGEDELGEPLNRRVRFIESFERFIGGSIDFTPVVLGEDDLVVSGDDDRLLRSLGIAGKILYTPGHTKDSISVGLDEGNAFVGDLCMSYPKIAGIKYRPFYIDSMEDLLASWRKVLEAGAKTIYPVHGDPFAAERLELFLRRHEARLR